MNARLPSLHITLAGARPLSVEKAQNTTVRVLEGLVWITEEGSLTDHFVAAGESFQLQRPGKTVLLSDGEARIELLPPTPVSVHTDSLWWLLPKKARRIEPALRPLALHAH